jgi:FixJ family two-component response regulator
MSDLPLICVVDDDAGVRDAISGLLRSLDYDVEAFRSADAFLASGCFADTWCLILDIMMPGTTGIGLQMQLIAKKQNIPIVFLSASASETVRANLLATGTHAVLTKPCPEQSLIGCVESAIEAYRRQRAQTGAKDKRPCRHIYS